jgi:hypothetical protein
LTRALFRTLFGPLLWAVHFSLLYLLHTAFCVMDVRIGDPAGVMLASSVFLTVGAVALLAWFFVLRWRSASLQPAKAFLDEASLLLVVLSAAGVVWAGAAAGFIRACAPLR